MVHARPREAPRLYAGLVVRFTARTPIDAPILVGSDDPFRSIADVFLVVAFPAARLTTDDPLKLQLQGDYMTLSSKLLIIGVASAAGAICPLCKEDAEARPQRAIIASLLADTATVRLHISRMTCATCTVTARVALKKLAGVHDATVSYGDSLGIVRYDPKRLTPTQIAEHLTRLTGYPAKILPDSAVVRSDSSRS